MTVNSASQLQARMFQVAEATRKAQLAGVKQATAVVDASIKRATPGRVRNASKSGGKLSTQVKVTNGSTPTGFVKAVGPWPLIEFDTPKHLIGIGRATTGSRASNRKSKRRARITVSNGAAIGGYLKGASYSHGVRGPVVHPGTHGKHVFRKGALAGTPKATAVLRKITVNACREAFA